MREAEIVAWHVSPGDHIVSDQPLLSVETDKAVVEIPAPYSGAVVELLVKAGEIVQTGAPIIEIATGVTEDAGAIVGDIRKDKLTRKETGVSQHPKDAAIRATPAVRKLAEDKGVDISSMAGSGPGGAILTADILAAANTLSDGEELRGVRRAMAAAMSAAHTSVVPATVTDRADVDAWNKNEKPMLRLIRAVGAGIAAEPALNAWFDGKRRKLHSQIDLAIAVDTANGLFAPVIRDAGNLDNMEQRLADLRRSVEDRTVAHSDMKGGTITLSNFGVIGGEFAALVVSPPKVAILGAGRIFDACLAIKGKSAVRRVMPLSLSFDHRVVTGGEAARFLEAVRRDLENAGSNGKDSS